MSILSASEFFRCIGPTATLQERHAALAKLVRLLVGDATHRSPPPISLPGRPVMPTAPPPAAPATTPAPRYFRQALPRGATINAPNKDSDGREPYSREQLERMDASFVERLERAIACGKERPHA